MRAIAARVRWQPLYQNTLTLVLAGAAILTLTASFQEAHWVRDDDPAVSALLLGLLFGWLLARSRWRSGAAAVYSLLLSLAAAFQGLGNLIQLPLTAAQPGFWPAVEQLNLRWVAFSLRAGGWFFDAFSGRRVEDSGFFVFLAALAAWNTAAWLVWWVVRRKNALPGLIPAGLLLAINVHLSRQHPAFLLVFLLCTAVLLARTTLVNRYTDWDRRGVDYPYDLGTDWGAVAFGLALVIVLTAWSAGLVGTPQAWKAMSVWLEKARQQTSQTAERLFPNVNPPPSDSPALTAETPNLREIGVPLPRSGATVMTVEINDPPPPPPGVPGVAPPLHYWRSQIFGLYTGRGWEPAATNSDLNSLWVALPAGHYALNQKFSILAEHADSLYAASQPVSASQGVSILPVGQDGSAVPEGVVDTYEIQSYVPRVTADELRSAGKNYPADILKTYLQLPTSLPERVGSLTERIAGGTATPYDEAVRVESYLRKNYTYDLDAETAPANADVVDDFLFRSRRGFCSHFASAMVVMLRTRGIPARVAAGYAMGSYDYDLHAYRVPASAAHAWVEVFFPGYGWIEFEPTAGVGTIQYAETSPGGAAAVPPADRRLNEKLPWILALGLFTAAAAASLSWRLWTSWKLNRLGTAGQSLRLYRQVRKSLAWLGIAADPAVTPREFLLQQQLALRMIPRVQAALRAVTTLHEQAAYSSHHPDQTAFDAARGLWENSRAERWQYIWRRMWGKPDGQSEPKLADN